MDVSRPIGVRVLEGAGLFIGVILAAGQTLALMDYALVTSCGPQEAADEVTAMTRTSKTAPWWSVLTCGSATAAPCATSTSKSCT